MNPCWWMEHLYTVWNTLDHGHNNGHPFVATENLESPFGWAPQLSTAAINHSQLPSMGMICTPLRTMALSRTMTSYSMPHAHMPLIKNWVIFVGGDMRWSRQVSVQRGYSAEVMSDSSATQDRPSQSSSISRSPMQHLHNHNPVGNLTNFSRLFISAAATSFFFGVGWLWNDNFTKDSNTLLRDIVDT